MKPLFAAFAFVLLLSTLVPAQDKALAELRAQIIAKDAELFDVGFNTCDIAAFENVIADEFTFLHDIGGELSSKADFIAQVRRGICLPNYKTRREADVKDFEIYPMRREGVIYAAIQNGRHRFYEFPNGIKTLRSTARFTHVWKLLNGQWKLTYSLSFDHQPVLATTTKPPRKKSKRKGE